MPRPARRTRAWCCWRSRGAATATWRTGSRWRADASRRATTAPIPGDVEGKVPNAPMLAGLGDCFALLVPAAAQGRERDRSRTRRWLKDLVPGARRDRRSSCCIAPTTTTSSTTSRARRALRRPADRRRRRRADARALAQAAAGHAHRDAPRPSRSPSAATRSRPTPSSTCARAPPGRALRAEPGSTQTMAIAETLHVLARRAEVRVPAGDRARRARRRRR